MKTKTYTPTLAATPAMIQAYWLQANSGRAPIFIRLANKIPVRDPRAAYLWAPEGHPEWRYAVNDKGIDTCPVVYHAPLTKKLDGIFNQHLCAIQCLGSPTDTFEPPCPIPIAERMAWVGTRFLCGSQPDTDDLFWQNDIALMVHQVESCLVLADECNDTLAAVKGGLYASEAGLITCRDRVIAMRCGAEIRFLDIDHPGNPRSICYDVLTSYYIRITKLGSTAAYAPASLPVASRFPCMSGAGWKAAMANSPLTRSSNRYLRIPNCRLLNQEDGTMKALTDTAKGKEVTS